LINICTATYTLLRLTAIN